MKVFTILVRVLVLFENVFHVCVNSKIIVLPNFVDMLPHVCYFYCSRSGSGGHEEKPSNVLFFTVYNPKYPITVVCIYVKVC